MEKTLKLIFEKMDEGFAVINQKFAAVEQRFEAMEQRFEAMEQRFEAIEQRLDAVEVEQKRQGELLHQLIQTVAATNVKISETNDRLATLEIKVDKLSEDVEEIKTVMATRKDLEYYDQMISEHAREIYKLKNR